MKTDWFELNQARLHLAPYTYPHFPIAVASATTPSGVLAAGKYGVGLLSLGAGLPGGNAKLADYWRQGEAEAAKHGKQFKRDGWRLVVNMHCAEEDERAFRDVARGERIETLSYFSETLGRPPMRSEDPLGDGLKAGTTLVGIARRPSSRASSGCWNTPRAAPAACCSARMNGPTARTPCAATSCSPAGSCRISRTR